MGGGQALPPGWKLFIFKNKILMKKFGLLAMLLLACSPLALHSVSANSDATDVTSTTAATTSSTADTSNTDSSDEDKLEEDGDAEEETTSEEDLDNDEDVDAAVNEALNTTETEEPQLISPTPTEVKSVDTGIAGGAAAAALLLGGGALYANAKRRKED